MESRLAIRVSSVKNTASLYNGCQHLYLSYQYLTAHLGKIQERKKGDFPCKTN